MERLIRLAGPGTIERPLEETTDGGTKGDGWIVTVFNNDHNTYDEVIFILMVATQCTADEAAMETWEIDHLGKSVVHHGGESECRRAAEVIATIGIRVEVSEEWA
ncbi:MAG: ATP-dependent Clp protease adaptor ClpS [Fimbriimonadaceae bacterium]|nr:ATP-dependent Clp protease adaptor ClpS [Fimbriimonadaceae bacterium]